MDDIGVGDWIRFEVEPVQREEDGFVEDNEEIRWGNVGTMVGIVEALTGFAGEFEVKPFSPPWLYRDWKPCCKLRHVIVYPEQNPVRISAEDALA